jgi:6-phosphogluconolactonase
MNFEGERRFLRFPDTPAMIRHAANLVLELCLNAVKRTGSCALVAAGGTTPLPLYDLLVQSPFLDSMPWGQLSLFWGDERCVAPTDPVSNYNASRPLWADRSRLSPTRVRRIRGELPAGEAASQYENELRSFFSISETCDGRERSRVENDFPSFDVILLGMGRDGHTASLFPGSAASEEEHRWVAAVETPAGNPLVPRVTLTLPVLNHGRAVMVLASGEAKAKIVHDLIFHAESASMRYPIARIAPLGTLFMLFSDA